MWARDATSGTMPPNWACWVSWEAIALARICPSLAITAAAVSSQLDSMPRTRIPEVQ